MRWVRPRIAHLWKGGRGCKDRWASYLGKRDYVAFTDFLSQIGCTFQSVHRSRFLLYCLNLFQLRFVFERIPSICAGPKRVCISFFMLIGECNPSVVFLRLTVLMRHSSFLDAILQSSNVTRPNGFVRQGYLFWALSLTISKVFEYFGLFPHGSHKAPVAHQKSRGDSARHLVICISHRLSTTPGDIDLQLLPRDAPHPSVQEPGGLPGTTQKPTNGPNCGPTATTRTRYHDGTLGPVTFAAVPWGDWFRPSFDLVYPPFAASCALSGPSRRPAPLSHSFLWRRNRLRPFLPCAASCPCCGSISCTNLPFPYMPVSLRSVPVRLPSSRTLVLHFLLV